MTENTEMTLDAVETLADLQNVKIPQDLPADSPTQPVAVQAAPAKTEKKATRGIRKHISDWMAPMTEAELKAIPLQTFIDKVKEVEPNWNILAKADKLETQKEKDKLITSHLAWYRSKELTSRKSVVTPPPVGPALVVEPSQPTA
jgi:hypothetical protein